jgi:molybdate transport repressor ModE-like protein
VRRVPDLESLQLLLHLAATGSLTKAAQRCGLGQPAASARLKAMERQVGTPLVERSPRGSRLTSAGVLVADWARETMESASVLDAGLTSLRSGEGRRLTIAASKTVAEHLVPAWLAGLARRHPGASMRLEAMNTADVLRALDEQSADLGFVEGPDRAAHLEDQEVSADELVLVVAPSHSWARRPGRRVTVPELRATRLVQRDSGAASRQALEAALRDHDGRTAEPLAEFSTNHAVVEAAITGWGPAVLSDLAVEVELAAGLLVEVGIAGVDLRRKIRAVWPTARPLEPLAAELVELAAQAHRRRPRGPRRSA